MPRPDVNIIKCSDGLEPSATSLFPLGNRGAGASDAVLSGTITHGGAARIATAGGVYKYGTAPAQFHAELAGAFYNQGNSVALASAWGSNTCASVTSGLRNANVGAMWKTVNDGRMSTGYLMDTIPASSKKLFLSYHTKFGSSVYRSMVASIASQTGSLTGGTDRARGELCTITLINTSIYSGYVTYEDGSHVTIDFVGSQPLSADFIGASIVGNVSGSIVVTGTDVAAIGSAKYDRVMHGATGSGARSWILRLHTSNGSLDYDWWDAAGVEQPTSGSLGDNLTTQSVNTWEYHELELDLSGVAGYVKWTKDGQTLIESTDIIPDAATNYGLRPTLIGMDLPGLGAIPEASVGALQLIDSIVFSTTRQRIVLTDNANYALSTKWEIQRHTNWDQPAIDFIVNRGEITSGGWFHVFNESGAIIDVVEAV
jgi:hypothetical protein